LTRHTQWNLVPPWRDARSGIPFRPHDAYTSEPHSIIGGRLRWNWNHGSGQTVLEWDSRISPHNAGTRFPGLTAHSRNAISRIPRLASTQPLFGDLGMSS